jgi:hypothetical protein
MASSARPKPRRIAPALAHSIITSIMLAMLAIMIVRDIVVRRWGIEKQPLFDVTHHSR